MFLVPLNLLKIFSILISILSKLQIKLPLETLPDLLPPSNLVSYDIPRGQISSVWYDRGDTGLGIASQAISWIMTPDSLKNVSDDAEEVGIRETERIWPWPDTSR